VTEKIMTTLAANTVGQQPATSRNPYVRPYPTVGVSATAVVDETALIERDPDLYHRAVARLANPTDTVPAEDVLGPLDEAETPQDAAQG
jgi:hypothetical protein